MSPLHPRRLRASQCTVGALPSLLVCVTVITLFAWCAEASEQTSRVIPHAQEEIDAWSREITLAAARYSPLAGSETLTQVFFVSCNRHDRDQGYWAYMAAAAQCEMATSSVRDAAEPCRRLFSGRSPLVSSLPQRRHNKMRADHLFDITKPNKSSIAAVRYRPRVPIGACGIITDNAFAEEYRLSQKFGKPRASRRNVEHFTTAAAVRETLPPLDALVWLGDTIYADGKEAGLSIAERAQRRKIPYLKRVEHMWVTQRTNAMYQAFCQSCLRRWNSSVTRSPADRFNVFGTWDDHDMGLNDAGKEFPYKRETQRFLLDFLDVPEDDPRWHRDGVYTFHTVSFRDVPPLSSAPDGDTGEDVSLLMLSALQGVYEHAVCLILLDVRFFRDPPNATYSGDMLGEVQWAWLEQRLVDDIVPAARGSSEKQPCALTLIGSGIEIMFDEKVTENWGAFPKSRDRLLHLLRRHHVERVAFLSGDVHLGELGADFTRHTVTRLLGYPMVEAVSSGLTHSVAKHIGLPYLIPFIFPSSRRVGLYTGKNFGSMRLSYSRDNFARMSDDVRSLTHQLREGEEAVARPKLRRALEGIVNVTFTIFSIPRHGCPALRLTFPLAMLTRESGVAYIDARAEPVRGNVYLRQDASKRKFADDKRSPSDEHYPDTVPMPPLTYLVRQTQRYVYRNYSLLSVASKMVRDIAVIVGSILVGSLLGGIVYCCWQLRAARANMITCVPPRLIRRHTEADEEAGAEASLEQSVSHTLAERKQKVV